MTPSGFTRLQVLTLDLPGRTHAEQARAACAGGARWVQFRTKILTGDARLAEARAVVAACREHGAVCVMNDTPALAIEVGADGVHLGREDMSPVEARALIGPGRILGVTVNTAEDAARVVREGVADYAGVGPWRFTTSKAKLAPVLSPEAWREIVATLAPLPCVIIGGVTVGDVPAIRSLGAHGVAVSSGIVAAPDPVRATREFLQTLA
jgi:thiamine-phosphate pyrophosphorylase